MADYLKQSAVLVLHSVTIATVAPVADMRRSREGTEAGGIASQKHGRQSGGHQ